MNIETQEKSEIRKAFENYRDERNALLESEGHKPGSKWHVTQAHYATWEAAQASIASELQPVWHPMWELPPFPFRGDIFADGKIIVGADWAGGGRDHGYWQSPKGDRGIERVSHWKHSNAPIQPPTD